MLIETMDGSIVDLVVDGELGCITDKERWKELKILVENQNASEFIEESVDWRNGYEAALGWADNQMKGLEKK